ncbi:MAG: sulfotransferase family protein [Actinomycetota bacterium]
MDAPFFIVASARSGTTAVRLTLNAHPSVAVPPESRFITELWNGSETVVADDFLRDLAVHQRFKSWELPIEAVAEQIGDRSSLPYEEAIACAYRAYAARHGKSRWGDKTPRYIEHIPFLKKLFPDARFIHPVRDGRDVALSYSHVSFGPKTVAKAAELWRRRVAAGIRDGRALPAGDYIEIRNEDLKEDFEGEVRDICAFLGLDFDPVMLDETEREKGAVRKEQHNYDPAHAGRKAMSDWRTEMKPSDVEVFEAVAGDVLSELGYERRFPAPSALARLKARLGLMGLPLNRL